MVQVPVAVGTVIAKGVPEAALRDTDAPTLRGCIVALVDDRLSGPRDVARSEGSARRGERLAAPF